MGTPRCQPIYFKNNYQRPYTLQGQTTSTVPKQICTKNVCNKSILGHDKSDRGFEGERCPRKTSSSECRLSFHSVLETQIGWKCPTYLRSQGSQQSCLHKALSHDFSLGCQGLPAKSRLDDENRHPTSIFPFAHLGEPQTVSSNYIQGRNTATNSTSFWPIFSPSNFCSRFELDRGDPSGERYSLDGIFRRLPPSKPSSIAASCPGYGDPSYIGEFGMARELRQIDLRANSRAGIPRPCLEYAQQYSSAAIGKDLKNKENSDRPFRKRKLHTTRSPKCLGPTELCQLYHSQRQTTMQTNADFPEKIPKVQTQTKNITPSSRQPGFEVVARVSESQYSNAVQSKGDPFLNDRRSGCGLGSSSEQSVHLRSVDNQTKTLAFKLKRNVCGIRGDKSRTRKPRKRAHSDTVGQSHPGSVYQKRGRHKVHSASDFDNQASGTHRTAKHKTVISLSPGEVQWHCRPPLQKSPCPRVASAAPGHGGHIQKVGRPRCRPVCIRRLRRRAKIRHIRLQRQVGLVLRRLQSNMGLSHSMGISTTQPNPTGPGTSERSERNLHTHSSSLDTMLLDGGHPFESSRRASDNQRSSEESDRPNDRVVPSTGGQAIVTGVENWGWADKVTHWSLEEKQLLNSSWRTSTLLTYNAPINRWISWCSSNRVNKKDPKGIDVAKFLTNLFLVENLAYKTILLHKSAISTYCATGHENISKNFFVQQVLKAISLAKPQPKKAPIWDTKLLFDWLKVSVNSNSLFNVSRRTALILLLASGRRIHDLTLLDISCDNLIQSEDEIILWPKFGSKTDNGTSRQSGWLLKRHPDPHLCPIEHIRKLIQISNSRRINSQSSMFISITGDTKSATRTMIAGWIRSVFKEAKIDAPPGSIRSAVASKSWLENRPIEEILSRGNWKSAQTFSNFYCRQVQQVNNIDNVDLLAANFSAV